MTLIMYTILYKPCLLCWPPPPQAGGPNNPMKFESPEVNIINIIIIKIQLLFLCLQYKKDGNFFLLGAKIPILSEREGYLSLKM